MPTVNPGANVSATNPVHTNSADIGSFVNAAQLGTPSATSFAIRGPAVDAPRYNFTGTGFANFGSNGLPTTGTITGSAFNDVLYGQDGADTLTGSASHRPS